jgi:hypothetical protein
VYQTPIVVEKQRYREMVERLLQYDGTRGLWRVLAGGSLFVGIPLVAVAAVVAGAYLVGQLDDPARVTLGALLAAGAPVLGQHLWRRRWWRHIVEKRLWSFERPYGGQLSVNFAIRPTDVERAIKATRRAHLCPEPPQPLPAPRPEAPELTWELVVRRPEAGVPEGEDHPAFQKRVDVVLRRAGVETCLHGYGVSLPPGSVA